MTAFSSSPPIISPFQYQRLQSALYSSNGEPKPITPSEIASILGISPTCSEPSGVYFCVYKGRNFSIYCYFRVTGGRYFLTNWQQKKR